MKMCLMAKSEEKCVMTMTREETYRQVSGLRQHIEDKRVLDT